MTDTPLPADIGARMLADRTARGMSRSKYAALIGLTTSKVSNIEHGRPPKPEEIPHLQHLAFIEPIASSLGVPIPADSGADVAPESLPPEGVQQDLSAAAWEADQTAQRVEMINAYNATVARLSGKPSKIAYNLSWGTPDVATPAMWPRILMWCADVNAWLDQLAVDDLTSVPPVVAESTSMATEAALHAQADDALAASRLNAGVVVVDEPIPEDEESEEDLAVVTDAPWAFPDDGIRRVSNGQLKTFKRCRRKYWLTYYRRLGLAARQATGAAPLGTRVHRCLAVWYVPEGQDRGDPLAELERTFQEDLALVAGDEIRSAELVKEVDLARAMLEGYFEWLAETGADEGLRVIAPETTLEVDARIPNTHLIAKIDVRVERTFGAQTTRLVLDHKTTGSFVESTKMLQFDEQMLHYTLCEYLNYLDAGMTDEDAQDVRVEGALYNLLRKVKRTATAKPPFYDRVEARFNVHTLRSYWLRVAGIVEEIERFENRLAAGEDPLRVAYPTPTRDCSWDCDYYAVCTMADDGSRFDDMLAEYFVEVNPLQRYAAAREGETL